MLKLDSSFSQLLISSMNSPAPGMKSIIDRYNRQKETENQQHNPTSEIKVRNIYYTHFTFSKHIVIQKFEM
ncbi:hypothetical protein LINPERPRIM_LOCUS18668 [Linum perenne]